MNKTTDLKQLGTEYTVIDKTNNPFSTVRVIWQDEILGATMGEYNERFYSDYDDYLTAMVKRLRGFASDIHEISWFATTDEEFDIRDALQVAVHDDNNIVIIEVIPNDELSHDMC